MIPTNVLLKILCLDPVGVLHVGAHLAEERRDYLNFGWGPIVWIEANPILCQELLGIIDPLNEIVIEGAAWNSAGDLVELKLMNNSQTTSLYDFDDFQHHPEVKYLNSVFIETISLADAVFASLECFGIKPEYIHLDIQGAELEALKGLGSEISGFKVISTEVATKEIYRNQPLLSDIDTYLARFGFRRVFTRMVPFENWGDAVYVNRGMLPHLNWNRRLRLLMFSFQFKYKNLKWAIAMRRESRDSR